MNIVFGASGHAKELCWLLLKSGIKVDYVVDVNYLNEYFLNIKIISEEEFLKIDIEKKSKIYIAVGNVKIRKSIFQKLFSNGFVLNNFPNFIHPSVIYNSETVLFGNGILIYPNSTLTTEIELGNFVNINVNASISHECKIHDFCTISPNSSISGNVKLNENVFIGANATLVENIEIIENTIIGAGAVVIKSIYESGTYVGVPAKKIANV